MRVYVDLTSFFWSPARTGIQRVCGELCKAWPAGRELVPVRLTQNGALAEMPAKALDVIKEYFAVPWRTESERIRYLVKVVQEMKEGQDILPLKSTDRLLVPELVYAAERIAFFNALDAGTRHRCYLLIYDFLPFTHPEYFPRMLEFSLIHAYCRMLRNFTNLAFISNLTRRTYCTRIRRNSFVYGPVFGLGSDGLGGRPSSSRCVREMKFVVVGTIEPRKNHELILGAFEILLQKIPNLKLAFAGRVGHVSAEVVKRVKELSRTQPWFEFCEDPDDNTIRRLIEGARATLFISAAEGFGLPPVESLWLGTPVIASAGIPSLEQYGTAGIHVVDPLDEGNLTKAVLAFLDEGYYRHKAAEAYALELPTWASFAAAVAGWVTGSSQQLIDLGQVNHRMAAQFRRADETSRSGAGHTS